MAKEGFKGEPQKEQRKRPAGFHSARQNKGHPRRQARRDRAAARHG